MTVSLSDKKRLAMDFKFVIEDAKYYHDWLVNCYFPSLQILKRLNISVASSSMDATHFVADKFTRTKNMLEAIALGKLIVNHLWLESCGQANCFIDEKHYILRDMKKEKEIGFNMPVSLALAREKPLLKVFI